MPEVSQIIMLVLTFITAVGALWAAKEARRSVQAVKTTTEAQLLIDFIREYASTEMKNSLRTLVNWKHENGDNFASIFYERLTAGDKNAIEVDEARRRVIHYYLTLRSLAEGQFVSDNILKAAAGSGIGVLYHVVEPLELALDKKSGDLGTSKYLVSKLHLGEIPDLLSPIPTKPHPNQND